jgi:hypothetical protein
MGRKNGGCNDCKLINRFILLRGGFVDSPAEANFSSSFFLIKEKRIVLEISDKYYYLHLSPLFCICHKYIPYSKIFNGVIRIYIILGDISSRDIDIVPSANRRNINFPEFSITEKDLEILINDITKRHVITDQNFIWFEKG